MTWTWLTHIDPTTNANRWYAISVQPTLFDSVAVVRFWSGMNTSSWSCLSKRE